MLVLRERYEIIDRCVHYKTETLSLYRSTNVETSIQEEHTIVYISQFAENWKFQLVDVH